MRRLSSDPTQFQTDLLGLAPLDEAMLVHQAMTDIRLTDDDVKRLISGWIAIEWERMSFVDVQSRYPRGEPSSPRPSRVLT